MQAINPCHCLPEDLDRALLVGRVCRESPVAGPAIRRFLRPVCYQNLPAALLPEALQDANPLGVTRLVDGRREL